MKPRLTVTQGTNHLAGFRQCTTSATCEGNGTLIPMGANEADIIKRRDFEIEDSEQHDGDAKPEQAKPTTPSRKVVFDTIMERVNRAGKQIATLASIGFAALIDFSHRSRAKPSTQAMAKGTAKNARNGHYTGMGTAAIGA